MIHELRSDHQPEHPASLIVHVDARSQPDSLSIRQQSREQTRTRPATSPRCRHAQVDPHPADPTPLNLDIWVQRTDRYAYTIDRRVLDEAPLGPVDADLARIGVVAKTLAKARDAAMSTASAGEPIELRNIHAGTPLWLLGLRTGDRLLAIWTSGEPELEHIELSIERRGRALALSYELI
ncbi:hypothetical protein DB30_03547 [Enhygromyxa salina]|uniref:Uncharacterized protein n=1 Tax=Enhygromyxa salina TaxID=215803 RepID=A0A0C1ZI70_9BACT|nr:hypothetical protein DB30_03547 [Enhygromyxa salina]